MRDILTNKWFKFGVVIVLYLLWAYWVGSWWLLILVPVIFDVYITKRVHWAFWKKKGVKKQTKVVEWIDALIFAVVVLQRGELREGHDAHGENGDGQIQGEHTAEGDDGGLAHVLGLLGAAGDGHGPLDADEHPDRKSVV